MSRAMKFTLLAIAGFFLAVSASFIWFVATWDPSKEDAITGHWLNKSDAAATQLDQPSHWGAA